MSRRPIIHRVAPLACVLLLTACIENTPIYDPTHPDVVDTDLNLSRKDYSEMLKASKDPNVSFKTKDTDGPPIPDLAPILAQPQAPQIGQTKLVSVTVTDDVPLKDVLLELARLADVDIEVDANITGGVSFRAKDRPFNEVIERISNLAGLRYTMKDGVLRVERDTPYVEVYPLDFLNIDRNSSSSVNISTNVLSSGGTGGGGGLNTGSSASVNSTSNSDFWKQFDESVKQILNSVPASRLSTGTVGSNTTPIPSPGAATTPAAATSAAPGGKDAASNDKTFYILNKQGSTLTVNATARQHAMLKRFLKQLEASASAQVLIEAKIVEVTLDKEFQAGIDWTKIGGSKIGLTTNFGTSSVTSASLATFGLGVGNAVGDLDGVVKLAENFGTTRTLSSPRLHAINNQQAVLTFAENQVYFQLTVTQSSTTTVGAQTTTSPLAVNSNIKTVPIGIIMTMLPVINLESGEITLDIRPTLSNIVGNVEDPAVAYLISQAQAAAPTADFSGITSNVPVVQVRELESILKLRSGQVMVIGGLMQDQATQNDTGIPFVNSIPVLGQLFNGTNRANTTSELVIFIRATIIDSTGDIKNGDKGLYKKFTNDPRPLDF